MNELRRVKAQTSKTLEQTHKIYIYEMCSTTVSLVVAIIELQVWPKEKKRLGTTALYKTTQCTKLFLSRSCSIYMEGVEGYVYLVCVTYFRVPIVNFLNLNLRKKCSIFLRCSIFKLQITRIYVVNIHQYKFNRKIVLKLLFYFA